MSLFTLNESFTYGYSETILNIFTLTAIFCAISVIVSKNPIISVLFLIGLFLSIASYLIIIGISFIGISYLLVYVGAVSILFLFILMLINVRISELLSETRNSIPLVFIIALVFNSIVYQILPSNINILNVNIKNEIWYSYVKDYISNFGNNNELSFVTTNGWDNALAEVGHITSIGNIMYTSYSIWLIITSVILLLAMVGAIVITIKQKN